MGDTLSVVLSAVIRDHAVDAAICELERITNLTVEEMETLRQGDEVPERCVLRQVILSFLASEGFHVERRPPVPGLQDQIPEQVRLVGIWRDV